MGGVGGEKLRIQPPMYVLYNVENRFGYRGVKNVKSRIVKKHIH